MTDRLVANKKAPGKLSQMISLMDGCKSGTSEGFSLPVRYDPLFAAWQKRWALYTMGKSPPPYPARIASKNEIEELLRDPRRYLEGMARWAEDVTIRSYLQDPDWQILYREASPLHRGFDFVAKHTPTGEVRIIEMKMSGKVGRLNTYLKGTKTKGKQMSLSWIRRTAPEIQVSHPIAYEAIMTAIGIDLLRRRLIVANHKKRPRGWLSASFGKMGMKGFYEEEFRSTPGFE